MSSARAAFYFIGTALLVVAAISVGQQLNGSDPIEWQGPCLLAIGGLGVLGIGIFSNIQSTNDAECNDPRADGTGDLGADPD
jgi:hypothetical protein